MAEPNDVFKLFKDLEMKAVGVDPNGKMQEGYFVSFRSIGLPIISDDFRNPYSPTGGNLAKAIQEANAALAEQEKSTPAVDPKDVAPVTASSKLTFNQAYAAAISKSQQSYINTHFLVDDKLRMNAEYAVMPGSSKVSDSWYAIIHGANGIASKQELNDEMKKAYEEASAVLVDAEGNPTRKYEMYMQYEQEYLSKVRARNKEYANAFTDPMRLQNWPVNGAVYQQEVEQAWDRWIALGKKPDIEKALSLLAAQGIDPAIVLIGRAKKRFVNSLITFPALGDLPYTFLSPTSWWDANNDDGWSDYSSHDFHSKSTYESSSTSYGGGVGVHAGLWSGGASFQHADTDAAGGLAVENLTMRMKYCAVDIRRPWLDTSLLNLKNWFLVGDYKKGTISSGKMSQELPAGGIEPTFLPSLTTSLILVKDVRISWRNWKAQWQSHIESNSGKASAGIYFFTANANYSRGTQRRSFEYDDTGEELVIPGIQLVGYVSAINPLSPHLDSSKFMKG